MPDDRPRHVVEDEMRLIDKLPPAVRALVHEFDLSAVVDCAALVGISNPDLLRRALEHNARLEQEAVEAQTKALTAHP